MNLSRKESGKKGEELALGYLKKQGYKILEKNYKTKLGEIDIIGMDGRYCSFIEVRSRENTRFGSPEESIDIKKRSKLIRAALFYIKNKKMEDKPCRFDVVAVLGINSASPKINLIKNAFQMTC
ncbi:MAG: YraN family protein [Candidatus Omnitrophota bacterium]